MTAWLSTQPKLNSRSKSGYILFSAEVRRRIMAEHPERTFGDVSKMVGVEVRTSSFVTRHGATLLQTSRLLSRIQWCRLNHN